jgi:hypothetical protein
MEVAPRKKFQLWHSLLGGMLLLVVEAGALRLAPAIADWIICAAAIFGSVVALYVATEVIEEVRGMRHMLELLSIVIGEFVIFFAVQYHFLAHIDPTAFPGLSGDPLSLLLNSTMVFVFNPLWVPQSGGGRALLLVNTLAALGLVLFVLQNISQIRRNGS